MEAERFRATRDRLEILDRAGNARLVFTRLEDLPGHAADLSGTQWRLVYDGDGVVQDSEFTLFFLQDGLGAGTTSCRDFVTAYKTRKERINFHTTGMIGPHAGCPAGSMRPEGRFGDDLSRANEYSVEEGNGQSLLHFRTSRGRALTLEEFPNPTDSVQGVEWRLTVFIEPPEEGPGLLPMGTRDTTPGTEVTLIFEETGLRGVPPGATPTNPAPQWDPTERGNPSSSRTAPWPRTGRPERRGGVARSPQESWNRRDA